jgi:hypothetical protein
MSALRKGLIALVVLLTLLVAASSAVIGTRLAEALGAPSATEAEATAEPGPTPEPARPPTSERNTEELPPSTATLTDAPAEPDETGDDVEVVDDADGDACDTSGTRTIWGGYPAATCRFYVDTEGLVSEDPLAEGSHRVAAQRDLGIENPSYAEGQSNTWWVWAQSDGGTWDWFPATALAEGASDQPVNGVALAQ